ncbi:MAG: hypothetical protein L3J20_06085 [Flavobacteriaceae bacterium]|nr:hypothetical protein [Flavobacteriaceae bacterium]
MFSKGQQLFGLFFVIVFAIILVWSYRKDLKVHKKYYKNVWIILISILSIFFIFRAITYYIHD